MLTFDEQLQRETTADESAAVEVLKQYIEAAESGNIDGLPRAKIILGRLFADIKAGIEFEQDKPAKGPAGALRTWLKGIDSSVAAVITLRYVLSFLLGNNPKTATPQVLMRGIGRGFELEVMINKAYKVNPVYVDRALSNLKTSRTVSQNHIQRTMAQVYTNVLQLSDTDGLSATDAMRLGKFGLNACLVCGMIVIHRTTNRKGTHVYYDLIPDVREFLNPQNYNTNLVTAADQLSMLAPPRPWVESGVGGYYSPRRQAMYPLRDTTAGTLRKSARKEYRRELHPDKIPMVYSVVNYLQAQPFEVKSDIYDLIMQVWKEGGGALGIPTPSLGEKPAFPFPDTWSKHTATPQELDVFQQWKLEAVAHYGKVAKHMSHVRECTTFLKIAKGLQGSEVYHPVYLDFRGRLYYRGTPNPQGADLARAVLHFHNKKALGKRGVFWLKVHIANSLGYDKVSTVERAAYVDSIWNRLASDLSAPADSEVYRGADNPLSTVAGVTELAKAYASGNPELYETGIIVHMDATCSGLQHFSAMLRDPVGGSYVNLINVGKKADVYTRVADLVKEQVRKDAQGDGTDALYAKLWEDIPIDRTLTKKPVMTYVYGATQRGAADDVLMYLVDQGWEHAVVSKCTMSVYMARVLFRAIEGAVPSAAAAMRWLRDVVKECARDTPIGWNTPIGFPVKQDYREIEETKVRIRSCGVAQIVSYESTDNTNISRSRNAISPNFVHSLDATHLMMTAEKMRLAGLSMVTIHDSFGTHPSDVDTLLRYTKSAFIELYTQHNVLQDLLDAQGLSLELPVIGDLDLSQIMDSEYFFT